MKPVLAVHGLVKTFGSHRAVDGVTFEVAPGECFGLLGPNGAGKSTTLKLALGLMEPDAGRIDLLGEPVPARARESGRSPGPRARSGRQACQASRHPVQRY